MLARLHSAAPRLIASLFAGLGLTVAAAWYCELRPGGNVIVDLAHNVPLPPDLVLAGGPTTAAYYHRSVGPGRMSEWHDDLKVKSAGWPLLAMRGVEGPARTYLPSTILLPDTAIVPKFAREKILPLRPIPLGFAADTLLFGSASWLGFAALARLRAAVRRARGRCGGCGYPRAGEERCPECGR